MIGDSAVTLASGTTTSSVMVMTVVASWSPRTALRVKSPEAVNFSLRVRTPLLMTPTKSPSM